ncbi:interferon alpha-13-like protein [Labeo rohita]|uniref:Interferon alpha-13-like protein n=1 Tax=Labeo rohita TaxID=84645 RepID=A0A498P5U4_LABRO|nr:interferon alpha-13-like [Labeo rohita]XP_050956817.1 interferon alpha-13-like [Labeo rohita]RXN39623.1 interferon alpha-13-like protein [Labeo rohita]
MDLHRVALLCTFFCFAQVWSRPTNCILREDLLKRSYTVIETAGGLFPVQCLDENVVIPFPQNAFESDNTDQVTGVEKSVYQTLENINALFEKFEDYTGPDQRFTENWNEFRGLVYRQIKESKCIKSEAAQDFPSREASLKVYFETITSTLKEKDFSYCAWEIVRKEILHTLKFVLDVNSNVKFLR